MTATLRRRAEQNVGGGGGVGVGVGAPTSSFRRRGKIFGSGGVARPA
jgi:hypothetical protein